MNTKINDLRSALEYLRTIPGQLIETDVEADPRAEISGIYRYVGAKGTVKRPTRLGPAMIFNNVKGHPGARVAIGVLSSRERVGHLLGSAPEKLGFLLKDSVSTPIDPVVVSSDQAPCQEVVHLATEEGFDIRKLIPAPTNTEEDAGPYVTMGLCYGTDPETGVTDVTIHSACRAKTKFPCISYPDVIWIPSVKNTKKLANLCLFPSASVLIPLLRSQPASSRQQLRWASTN